MPTTGRPIQREKWLERADVFKATKRPNKLTTEILQKLREAFSIDASIEEACLYAGIASRTYYNWIKKFPTLFEELDQMRHKPSLVARQEVVRGLAGDKRFSLDYLRNKRPNEFNEKVRVEHSGELDHNIQMSPEVQKATEEYEKKLFEATKHKPKEA